MSYVEGGPWDDFPDAWGKVVLGGKEVPGRARVRVNRGNKWDEKPGQAQHGADRNFKGAGLAKLRIELEYWTTSQHDEIEREILPIIEPEPGKKKHDAISISHAVAAMRKVGHITIDNVDGPDEAESGIRRIVIDATEHRPPTAQNAKGKAKSGPDTGKQAKCAELALEYLTYQAYYHDAIAKAEAIPFYDLKPKAAMYALAAGYKTKLLAIAAEQVLRGCDNTKPSQSSKTIDP